MECRLFRNGYHTYLRHERSVQRFGEILWDVTIHVFMFNVMRAVIGAQREYAKTISLYKEDHSRNVKISEDSVFNDFFEIGKAYFLLKKNVF